MKTIYFLCFLFLVGCSTHTSSNFKSSSTLDSSNIDLLTKENKVYPNDVYITSKDIDEEYVILGKLKVTVNKTTIFHPDPTKELVNLELQKKASEVGADAIIKVIYDGPRITGLSWGTMDGVGEAIRYKNKSEVNIKDDKEKNVLNYEDTRLFSFDEAIVQCEFLGLEKGTDKFSDCVLKLSK